MAAARPAPEPRPWTLEGDYDPAYDDDQRELHHRLLTDPFLAAEFRRRFPLRRRPGYELMVRALGCVWDCPDDGTANVTGYCCAACGQPRTHPHTS
jgi:hypothetical protein